MTLTLRDRVFVLGIHIPRELIVENTNDEMAGNARAIDEILAGSNNKGDKNKWNKFFTQDEEYATKKGHGARGVTNDKQLVLAQDESPDTQLNLKKQQSKQR